MVIENGKHFLSGVGYDTIYNEWNNEYIDVDLFCIDGIVYGAHIDPDDGYRSYGIISPYEGKCQYTFPPQEVIIENNSVDIKIDDWQDDIREFLTISDAKTYKLILEIGTNYSESYYPCAIFNYMPENLSINQGK